MCIVVSNILCKLRGRVALSVAMCSRRGFNEATTLSAFGLGASFKRSLSQSNRSLALSFYRPPEWYRFVQLSRVECQLLCSTLGARIQMPQYLCGGLRVHKEAVCGGGLIEVLAGGAPSCKPKSWPSAPRLLTQLARRFKGVASREEKRLGSFSCRGARSMK